MKLRRGMISTLVVLVCVVLTVNGVVSRPEWAAVLPAVVALLVAVATQRILLALACGGLCGAVLVGGGDVVAAAGEWVMRDVLGSVAGSQWKLIVVVVTLLMGGFSALLEGGGAVNALFERLRSRGYGARAVVGGTFVAGLVCFFDGLANSLFVGRVMRGAFDRAGLARERLAFIADSTASPVACVALASTWIAYQLAMIKEGTVTAGVEVSPIALYLSAWPGMFYCWASLLCVALFVFGGWTIGPMCRARAVEWVETEVESGVGRKPGIWRFLLPVFVLLISLVGGLFWDGTRVLAQKDVREYGLHEAFGAADAGRVLLFGTLAGCVVAFVCFPKLGKERAGDVFLRGVQGMVYPVGILLLAWALGSTLKQLGAAGFLAGWIAGGFPIFLYPAVVFLVACLVSFSTGTSWGTMGVLTPVALPAAFVLAGSGDALASPVVAGTVAAVMSGAVFGDHCSPVSDTTIVSATAAGCDPWAHVVTQLPYALIAGGISLLLGFVPWGLGVPVWVCLSIVGLGLLIIRFFVYRGQYFT